MAYGFYNVTLILEDVQEERLKRLEERFKLINGWNKQEIMQFAVASSKENTEAFLTFAEQIAERQA